MVLRGLVYQFTSEPEVAATGVKTVLAGYFDLAAPARTTSWRRRCGGASIWRSCDVETRRHTVCHTVDWMTSDRHYPGEPAFPDLAMIGRIETEVERNDKIECETRYYLCSIALCALAFARVVRAHWGVENRLHWVLDVIFREDLARFRTGDGPQNMAIIRHTTLNLLSRAKPTVSLKNRRKRAGWNVDYLETLIRQTA